MNWKDRSRTRIHGKFDAYFHFVAHRKKQASGVSATGPPRCSSQVLIDCFYPFDVLQNINTLRSEMSRGSALFARARPLCTSFALTPGFQRTTTIYGMDPRLFHRPRLLGSALRVRASLLACPCRSPTLLNCVSAERIAVR